MREGALGPLHPFRDGNGRVSRLLILPRSYLLGFHAGRFVGIERLIEANKARCYETLEQSSAGCHENCSEPGPWVNFILGTLKGAYAEFEQQVHDVDSPRGAKTALVEAATAAKRGPFSLRDLERECSGGSRDTIRRVLAQLRAKGLVESLGTFPGAAWQQKM